MILLLTIIIMIKFRNILRTAALLNKYWRTFSKFTQYDSSANPYLQPVNVHDFLTRLAIDFKSNNTGFRIKQCVFCTKPHYNELTNLYTLFVNKNNGVFYCHRCAAKGSWRDLKARYLNADIGSLMPGELGQNSQVDVGIPVSDTEYFFYLQNLKKPEYEKVLEYLKQKRINVDTIQKYQVGAGTESFATASGKQINLPCLSFPIYQLVKKKKSDLQLGQNEKVEDKVEVSLVKYKMKGIEQQNAKFRFHPMTAKNGFFGLNTISKNDKIVVLTEGEINAMSINQQTGYPSIALSQGANYFPDSLISNLMQFDKIVLWFDNDVAGHIAEDKISAKLGTSRTYVVRNDYPDLKDANDFLIHAPQKMKQIIEQSKTKPSENILDFEDMREAVKNRIFRHEDFIGIQVDWFPFFNKKIKGIRMKQLTVVSGPTGCGKTTLLSQITLDLCKKDIPVLWGSFQIKNEVLITNMIVQFSNMNLFQHQQAFPHFSEQFKKLPLFFLNFHGSNQVEKVMATIQYSIQTNNISVVVLDTLQFLLAQQAQGYQKFDLQDKVLTRLRKMATDLNVHILVVIHPRKTEDNQDIQIHSIYGTSKASQEADNVWMIQNRQNFRIFDVKKNRFDGDLGKVAIGYNKNSKNFFQLKRNQLTQLMTSQTSIEEIVLKRQLDPEAYEKIGGLEIINERDQQQNLSVEDLIKTSRKK